MIRKLARTPRSSARVFSATLGFVAAVTAVIAVAVGSAAAASGTAGQAVGTATKLETDNYLVEISASGPYKAGAAGSVRVTLTTKGVFHINGQYPYRFKTASPAEGVSYPKPVLERADGQFTEKTAVFELPFLASHAGTVELAGVFHMSVCSPNSCLMQKAPLDISVSVQ